MIQLPVRQRVEDLLQRGRAAVLRAKHQAQAVEVPAAHEMISDLIWCQNLVGVADLANEILLLHLLLQQQLLDLCSLIFVALPQPESKVRFGKRRFTAECRAFARLHL